MSKIKSLVKWEITVRSQGCIITGQNDVQLHHVCGRAYRNNKVLIGPWFLLPLCMRLHDVGSNDPYNVTHYPKKFAETFGTQKDLFLDMCKKLVSGGMTLPFGDDVLDSIALTSR